MISIIRAGHPWDMPGHDELRCNAIQGFTILPEWKTLQASDPTP
jgi:hypothetical protein